jgi:hypothetical protein
VSISLRLPSFISIDYNPVDGDQTYKHTQQSLKKSHVVRESHRQSRAKRLAALKADDESNVLPKIHSCEIGVQSVAAQPLTKKYFLESASQASGHVDNGQDRSSILLHASKLLGPLGICKLDPLQVYPLCSNLQLYIDKIIDHSALRFQYLVKHRPRDQCSCKKLLHSRGQAFSLQRRKPPNPWSGLPHSTNKWSTERSSRNSGINF